MRRFALGTVVSVLLASVPACKQTQPLTELEGGAEVGLRRGASWSTIKVRPPYVIGPRINLRLTKGVFTGTIDGRAVNVRVDGYGLRGAGPNGAVALDIQDGPELVVDGTWNGARASLKVTNTDMRASLAILQSRSLAGVNYCQYVLDRVESNGARSGTSICGGLPEQTTIEVPAQVQGWLTRPELVMVLMALLSSPPFSRMELQ